MREVVITNAACLDGGRTLRMILLLTLAVPLAYPVLCRFSLNILGILTFTLALARAIPLAAAKAHPVLDRFFPNVLETL